ncbi:MAG: Translation initiation factor IF-3 [Candidatus Levybacteria bacterium GW2011_GWB1_37_8]|nr:MAG: Translation initiation factor IF-3 [Candidatus Levybacteria bacterium GW2011_GWC2_37_7]KKQ42260.1 MAG: Translation initiation factor IF-3 [Candidatus Levybacteria bacterium GW2011_GWB1_37_8]
MIRRFSKRRQDNRKFYRINDRIFASQLRVLDAEGKQIGVLTRFEALRKARELGVDLVEVAALANPPVVRIIDFKKFLYQESKKKNEEKKRSKVSETKEIRLGPFMNDHDLETMIRRGTGFLEDNNKVRLIVKFMGRQIAHPEFGKEIMQKVVSALSNLSKLERDPHFEGKQLIAILSPERKKYEEKNKELDRKKI